MIGHWLLLCPSEPADRAESWTIGASTSLLLRNTSVINFLDCCAITVPVQTVGEPVGLMIVGEHGAGRHFLGVGRGIEAAVIRAGSRG
jgi:aspartyl-tRNA(Asn)/glutamyl-tRNA(Gln) amidotransferase subunit A